MVWNSDSEWTFFEFFFKSFRIFDKFYDIGTVPTPNCYVLLKNVTIKGELFWYK